MQLGVSSYSFASSLRSGRLDVPGVIDWIADHDADHLEISIAGLGADLAEDPGLVAAIKDRAQARDVTLANYVLGADFDTDDQGPEIDRVLRHLDIAAELGITRVRHDVVAWGWVEPDEADLDRAIERIVPACQQVADRASSLGITTSVENHGMSLNAPDRLQRLVAAVDRENFRVTLDVGNFLCVGADPALSTRALLPHASVVHLKDFRVKDAAPGAGWLVTRDARAILGTVVGWGDLDLPTIAAFVVDSGFDGPISIEFEGPEDDLFAIEEGLRQARALFAKVAA